MGKGKLTADKIERLRGLKRAARIRERLAKGKVPAKERSKLEAELADLPQPVGKGRPRKHDPDPEPKVDSEAAIEDGDGATAPEGAVPSDGAVSPPPPPPGEVPPTPPRVDPTPRSRGDWRAKYRGAEGREGACREIATMYCSLLKRCIRFVEESGSRPIMDAAMIDESIFPAAVLTADKLLPVDFDPGPEVELVVGSGFIVGQAVTVAARRRKGTPRQPARVIPFVQPVQPEPPAADAPPPAEGGPPSQEVPRQEPQPIVITDPTVIY